MVTRPIMPNTTRNNTSTATRKAQVSFKKIHARRSLGSYFLKRDHQKRLVIFGQKAGDLCQRKKTSNVARVTG